MKQENTTQAEPPSREQGLEVKVPRTLEFTRRVTGAPLEKYWSAVGLAEALERENQKLRKKLEIRSRELGDNRKFADNAGALACSHENALDALLEAVDATVPDRNCSCHLSPPCGWCTEWLHLHDEAESARDHLKAKPRIFSLITHLYRQRQFSDRTFGPGGRAKMVIDHIRKELDEIAAAPDDIEEWIDVVILGLDGAGRAGASPEVIIETLVAKQAKNEARTWPDWRTADPEKAITHVKEVSDG
jgi:hypothetical protein